jgi:hypothetical protein
LNGNYYTDSAADKICTGTAYRILSPATDVTAGGAGDHAAKIILCETACTTKGTDCDWYGYVASTEICTLYKGTCTPDTGASGDIISLKTRHCYYTTQSTALYTNFDCKNVAVITISDVDMNVVGTYPTAEVWFWCHQKCQDTDTCQ